MEADAVFTFRISSGRGRRMTPSLFCSPPPSCLPEKGDSLFPPFGASWEDSKAFKTVSRLALHFFLQGRKPGLPRFRSSPRPLWSGSTPSVSPSEIQSFLAHNAALGQTVWAPPHLSSVINFFLDLSKRSSLSLPSCQSPLDLSGSSCLSSLRI